MNKKLKLISTAFTALLFITACGSASSDAKKVEVKQPEKTVEKAEEIKVAEAKAPEEVAKKAPPAPTPKSEFVEGVHYFNIFPEMQTNATAGKVEVIELMWLGCPHCYTLEPTMLKYKKDHPAYVEFQQVPAMLNPSWAKDADTYYLAEVLDPKGEKDLITKIFQAIHEQKRRLRNPSAVNRFFVQLGYSEDEIAKAKESMLFRIKIKRAQEISASSQAQSVPTIIINGKYRTSPYTAGGEEKLMKIIDMLTRKEKK
ncbi:MAG: thiol:disulfide interchange protein DsbA/DsbL [Cocleimonas sp.]|nr:thiol:disulfide interchange protein DsbA/DsbL [Cocleimonas sp.]